MLTDSLAYTTPQEVGSSEIVQEFYAKVLAWQDFVVQELPWAQAEADKAHRAREGSETAMTEAAPEEKFLDNLLATHGEIQDALDQYHRESRSRFLRMSGLHALQASSNRQTGKRKKMRILQQQQSGHGKRRVTLCKTMSRKIPSTCLRPISR